MVYLLVIGVVGLAWDSTRDGFLLVYQYGERTLSSIRALRLLLVSWRDKRSADLAQVGFRCRTFLIKSTSLSVCIINTGVLGDQIKELVSGGAPYRFTSSFLISRRRGGWC